MMYFGVFWYLAPWDACLVCFLVRCHIAVCLLVLSWCGCYWIQYDCTGIPVMGAGGWPRPLGWGQVTNWPSLFAGIFCGGTVDGILWAMDIDVAMDKVEA